MPKKSKMAAAPSVQAEATMNAEGHSRIESELSTMFILDMMRQKVRV
jgi:hypothetical protein